MKNLKLKPLTWMPNSENGKMKNNGSTIHTEYARVKDFNWILFKVEKEGKRKIKFVVQSFPFENGVFVKANNTKKLGEFETVEQAKEYAEKAFEKFVKIFVTES